MTHMLRASLAKRQRGGLGFTLIELLVVVVILGVLAAVVVFAVGGISDRGDVAAFSADADTLRTAQEANCAQNGDYVSEPELVSRGLLASESTLNDIVISDDPSGCGDKRFALTCPPTQAGCGQSGTVPDGNFAGFDGATPTGNWSRTGDLPVGSYLKASADMVTMPGGKVLFWGNEYRTGSTEPQPPDPISPLVMVYDPATSEWAEAPPVPGPARNALLMYSDGQMLVLEGSPAECGSLCGKVFVRTVTQEPVAPDFLNARFYVFDPVVYDAGGDPWRSIDPDPSALVLGGTGFGTGSATPAQMPCSRAANPGSDCGKVLMPGTDDDYETERGTTTPPSGTSRAALFDPAAGPTGAWALTPVPEPSQISIASSTPLGDGRVLIAGSGEVDVGSRIYSPFDHSWTDTPNEPSDLTYACTTSPTTRRHSTRAAPGILLPGGTQALWPNSSICKPNQSPPQNSMIFNAASNFWELAPGIAPTSGSQGGTLGVVLQPEHGSKVLIVRDGEVPADGQVASALFDPDPSSLTPWTTVGSPFTGRNLSSTGARIATSVGPSFTVLESGQVLMAGGQRRTGSSTTTTVGALDTWLYTPPVEP